MSAYAAEYRVLPYIRTPCPAKLGKGEDRIMKLEDFAFTDWHYSALENGMETRVRIAYCNGIASVLQIVRDEDGYFYYGVFCDYCDQETVNNREKCLAFIQDNETNGYSCGSFGSLEEVNAQMEKDGITGYGKISVF